MFSKRNIMSYSTIKTNMSLVDNDKRMRTERVYDSDTGIFLYSHVKDYEYDNEIEENKKIFITNKLEWYLNNREKYNIRYIPLFITRIKNFKIKKLEDHLQKNNIIKIEECNISTKMNEWNYLLDGKNITNLEKIFGKIYIIPSNAYQAVRANYKKELLKKEIIVLNNSELLSCKNSLTLSIPENKLFSILNSPSYYTNYDENIWYWFSNEENNGIIETCANLLNLSIINLEQNLCKVKVPINESLLNKILSYQHLVLKYLNNYEIDKFIHLNKKQECIDFIKWDVTRL